MNKGWAREVARERHRTWQGRRAPPAEDRDEGVQEKKGQRREGFREEMEAHVQG